MMAGQPPELIVYDELGPCSYLPGRLWRLPLRLPVRALTREEFGRRLSQGDRRQGRLLYRTTCPTCTACQPIRVLVDELEPGRTQRRILRRGNELIRTQFGALRVDRERLRLYNLHKQGRNLSTTGDADTGPEAYRSFLGDSCTDTAEIRYYVGGELLGVAIADRAADALSAVYFYWDPKFSQLSPGVYSILKQVEICRRLSVPYLYLGLYIADCRPMSYKDQYLPHERLVNGRWQRFDRPARR